MDGYKTDPSLRKQLEAVAKYNFDFENLAFEGGGAKMVAYGGAVKILDELGILQKCKRFAGTSGGALAAALLATGHTPEEMINLMKIPMEHLLKDSWWGKWSFLPNMFNWFGWNAGNGFLKKLREVFKDKTGNPDITFLEVYKRYGKELCVVATNMTNSSVEYFHPKTTPNLSVAVAVRCSVSLPVLMMPVQVKHDSGMEQLYVDGGVVVNYPLHVFDGWYLSMKKEDSFLKKLAQSDLPFGSPCDFNRKTLGVLLYTFWEDEILKNDFSKRDPLRDFVRPDTVLANERGAQSQKLINEYGKKLNMIESAKLFIQVLEEMDENDDNEISIQEFKNAVKKFQREYPDDMEHLFDKDFDFDGVIRNIETGGGKMRLNDFVMILQQRGIRWTQLLEGGYQVDPRSVTDFYTVLLNTSMGMSRRAYYKPTDSHRSVGVFTDYIYTADFKLQDDDINFLVRQGEIGTIQYLQDLIACYNSKEAHEMNVVVSPK